MSPFTNILGTKVGHGAALHYLQLQLTTLSQRRSQRVRERSKQNQLRMKSHHGKLRLLSDLERLETI